MASLLIVWFGIHELSKVPSGNIQGFAMVGTGMLILAWDLVNSPAPLADINANSIPAKTSHRLDPFVQARLNRPILYLGIIIGVIAILLSSNPALKPWPILIIWVIGIVLFLIGSSSQGSSFSMTRTTLHTLGWAKKFRWEILAVLVLTVLAFLARGIAVDTIPHNVHGDEGEMGLLARAVIRGELRDPFTLVFLSHPSLWFFIQALALQVFGNNIMGLRLLSALIGALTVPALYVFARPLYGFAVTILATTLLAFYHFHIHFSRVGLNNIADPLMMLLTLTALFHGYRKRSLMSFALAGVLMGFAQYLYFGTRFILVVTAAFVGFLLIKQGRQRKEFIAPIAWLVIGFLVSTGPLLRLYLAHPDAYVARLVARGVFQNEALSGLQANGQSLLTALLSHAYRSFGLFTSVNERGPFYNLGTPLLTNGMELLFIIGIVLALLNWRKLENFVLLIWVGGTAFFAGFLFDAPEGQRYLIATPALCILMALALVQVGLRLSQILAALQPWWTTGLVVAVAAFSLWNLDFYFNVYTLRNSYTYTPMMTDIGYYLRAQAGKRYTYAFTTPYLYFNYATIKFIANDPPGIDILDPLRSTTDLPETPTGLLPVFIFIPNRLNELEVVKKQFPVGELKRFSRPQLGGEVYLYIYEPR
jgi:uncharacterized membrane protein